MIQRIQTIYLLAAAMAALVMYWGPLVNFGAISMYSCHLTDPANGPQIMSMLVLAILPLLSVLLSFFTIFKFRNRTLQIKLGRFNVLLLITTLVLEYIYASKIGSVLQIKPSFEFLSIMPLVAMLFILLANRAIKKDDDLVKSADRIR